MSVTEPDLPRLGAAIRDEWLLDWSYLTVNHGSYGATPRVVLAAQDAWRLTMEQQPTFFMKDVLPEALRAAADRLGLLLGVNGGEIAFVDNATTGANAVLRSLQLGPGDEILLFSHAYRAVRNTAHYVAERSGGRVVEVPLPFPNPEADAVVAAFSGAISRRTRLAVVDHITSSSALVLPLERLVGACREAGVPVLVDGAHGPGQVEIDLCALGADWYAGNCHKWIMAPKGCAFLWARKDRQEGIHPVTISHGYGKGFAEEFDWTGTRDASAYLAIGAAIDFYESLGGPRLQARNAALAWQGAEIVARRLGTEIGANRPFCASMAVVRVPVDGPPTQEHALVLRERLRREFRCDVPLHAQAGAIWLRLSAQAYNEIDDYEALADIAAKLANRS